MTRLETIHLTLAFLGEVEEDRVPLLKNLRLKGRRHQLPVDTACYWKHNQIVWVGPAAVPSELREVVFSLGALLKQENFRTEEREFAAHITLIRKARVPQSMPELPAVVWPAEEIVLIRSRLSSKGPSYEVVQRYPFS